MDPQQILSANIIEELGIELLPDDKKAALITSMIDLIQKRIVARLIEGLSEDNLGKFADIVESKDPEALAQFASSHGKNLEEITKEETVKLKSEMIERGRTIR